MEKDKYNQAFITAFEIDESVLGANLVYESGTTIEVLAETYLSISLLC